MIKKAIKLGVILLLSFQNLIGQSIENDYFKVTFDKNTGWLSVHKKDGQTIFKGCINTINADQKIYTSDAKNYTFDVKRYNPKDEKPTIIITGFDKAHKLDFEKRVSLYQDMSAIEFEVIYKNVSGNHLQIYSVEPVRITENSGGSLYYNNAEKCITNGAMYYDAGMVHDFNKPYKRPEPYGETKGGIPMDTTLKGSPFTIDSWWNISILNGYDNESLHIGYIDNQNSLGRIRLLKNNNTQLSLIVESVFNPGYILGNTEKISSDKCAIVLGENPYSGFDIYADLMSETSRKRTPEIINGWCNWFYTLDNFSEDEILRNAETASREFKPYGMEYIQIDEGFQNMHGDWEGNEKFPHGLKWLCTKIKDLGLKPGIWIAPFVISENTDIFKQHPDWLLKDENGEPLRIGPWPSENTDWFRDENPKRYCLDISHPDAERWFVNLFDTIINNWGFEMIKIDFVAWTVFSAKKFYDPGITPAQLYRKALGTIRKSAGDKCHILDCGPGNISGPYINSMRIEYDQNYGFSADAWKQYFIGSSSSAGASGKRYFYHNKLWVNDIDHVCLDLLSEQNAEAVVTLIGLSGGNIISGDRLMNLSNSKKEILRKILPGTIEHAVPVDLLENEPQIMFASHINRKFGQWDILALFNPDLQQNLKVNLKLARLWLDSTKTYLFFDFWNEKFIGEFSQNIGFTINPGNVRLFSIHEKPLQPKIISTNRHIKQGALEISDSYYDTSQNVLYGISNSPEGSSHSIFVYVPDGYNWSPENGKIYEYHQHYTIRKIEDNIIRVDVFFNYKYSIEWEIQFLKK